MNSEDYHNRPEIWEGVWAVPVPIDYESRNTPLAQKLRREMTRQERHLWYDFLHHLPVRFRRQKQFGDYIVDFYCAAHRLVIELDGSQHYEPEMQRRDDLRTAYLESLGLRVVRFSNHDVDVHFEAVCVEIEKLLQETV